MVLNSWSNLEQLSCYFVTTFHFRVKTSCGCTWYSLIKYRIFFLFDKTLLKRQYGTVGYVRFKAIFCSKKNTKQLWTILSQTTIEIEHISFSYNVTRLNSTEQMGIIRFTLNIFTKGHPGELEIKWMTESRSACSEK